MTEITRKRGDTYGDVFTLTDKANNQPLNVAGYTGIVMTLDDRVNPADTSTQVYQLAATVLGPTSAGKIEFAPTLAQADRVGRFFFDIQLTDPAGRIRTVMAGRYTYLQDITKA
jgi:hypothetical protein